VLDQVVQGLEGRILEHGQADGRRLKQGDGQKLVGFVTGVAPGQRLEDDVGNVDPGFDPENL
jgi:hypothetical protein